MIKIYETKIQFRNIQKDISSLKKGSHLKVKMKCQECGKSFSRHAFILFKSGNFLCQKCSLSENSRKKLNIGDKYNMLTITGNSLLGKSNVICECGKEKIIDNYNITSGKTKSCGCIISSILKAFNESHPEHNSGENHPMWKGGVSGDRRRIMATNKYKEWRSNVFKRDDYKCKKCNKNSNTLEAHHINEFANNKLLATELDNGITFCKKCHKLFHKTYGNSNLNIEKVNEFINT